MSSVWYRTLALVSAIGFVCLLAYGCTQAQRDYWGHVGKSGYDSAAQRIKDDPTPFSGAGDLIDYAIYALIGAGSAAAGYKQGQKVERKKNGNGVAHPDGPARPSL